MRNLLVDRFGSPRGFLYLAAAEFKFQLNQYVNECTIAWSCVERLVFVCKGNVCRSAYSERVALLKGLPAVSYGLEVKKNGPARQNMVELARERCVDLSKHSSKSIVEGCFRSSDLILVMEPGQIDQLRKTVDLNGAQVTLLGLWSSPRRVYIHDPYSSSDTYAERSLNTIDSAIDTLLVKYANRS